MTSASVEDENTLDEPKKVAPVSRGVAGLGPQFTYTFAPNSLTILRLNTATKWIGRGGCGSPARFTCQVAP